MKNQELRALMDSKGYQQKQVAQLLGVSICHKSVYISKAIITAMWLKWIAK